jgi:hypothetical protein
MKYILIALLSLALFGCNDESTGAGANWSRMQKLKPENTFGLTGEVSKRSLKIGEALEVTAQADRSGRLWILTVDSDDQVEMLFPNDRQRNNSISAGSTLRVPASDASWELAAGGPTGQTMLAIIVTTGTADLRDLVGVPLNSERAAKGLRVINETPWAIVRQTIKVQPK